MEIWTIILVLMITIGIYVWGIIFEYEYPYILLLRKVAKLRFTNGENILEYLRKNLPKVEKNKRWHRCSYDRPQDLSKDIKLVLLQEKSDPKGEATTRYRFLYNTRKNEIFPAFAESWDRFGKNWGKTELVDVTSPRGDKVKIPADWREVKFS